MSSNGSDYRNNGGGGGPNGGGGGGGHPEYYPHHHNHASAVSAAPSSSHHPHPHPYHHLFHPCFICGGQPLDLNSLYGHLMSHVTSDLAMSVIRLQQQLDASAMVQQQLKQKAIILAAEFTSQKRFCFEHHRQQQHPQQHPGFMAPTSAASSSSSFASCGYGVIQPGGYYKWDCETQQLQENHQRNWQASNFQSGQGYMGGWEQQPHHHHQQQQTVSAINNAMEEQQPSSSDDPLPKRVRIALANEKPLYAAAAAPSTSSAAPPPPPGSSAPAAVAMVKCRGRQDNDEDVEFWRVMAQNVLCGNGRETAAAPPQRDDVLVTEVILAPRQPVSNKVSMVRTKTGEVIMVRGYGGSATFDATKNQDCQTDISIGPNEDCCMLFQRAPNPNMNGNEADPNVYYVLPADFVVEDPDEANGEQQQDGEKQAAGEKVQKVDDGALACTVIVPDVVANAPTSLDNSIDENDDDEAVESNFNKDDDATAEQMQQQSNLDALAEAADIVDRAVASITNY